MIFALRQQGAENGILGLEHAKHMVYPSPLLMFIAGHQEKFSSWPSLLEAGDGGSFSVYAFTIEIGETSTSSWRFPFGNDALLGPHLIGEIKSNGHA